MKLLKIILILLSSIALGGNIGFEAFNPPPYPTRPAHLHPEPALYPPLPQNNPYSRYPVDPPPAYTTPVHLDSSPITACRIPAGTYRFDAYDLAISENITVSKLVIYLTVNDAGIMAMRLKLKPKRGREEQYLAIPYHRNFDLTNVCNGINFSFPVERISVYGKTLSGHISGHLTTSDGRGNIHLSIDGLLERYDASWNSKVTISLAGQKFEYIYSYVK